MTTFTMQDLNPNNINDLPSTPEEDEAFKALEAMAKLGAGIGLKEMFTEMGQDLTEPSGITPSTPNIPTTPQTGTNVPDLASVLQTISEQFALLATVISQAKAQPNTTPPEGANLQDCVEQVLTQAVWFDELVRETVESVVNDSDFEYEIGNQVERYMRNVFDPNDHVDFDSLVRDTVEDMLEDIVSEKLSEASVSISF